MAITLANLNGVEKPRYAQVVNEDAVTKLAFVRSGVIKVMTPAELGFTHTDGARSAMFPYWNTQSTTHTDLVDANTATSPQAITAGEQIGRMLYRGNAWGATWLAKQLIGSDPLGNLSQKLSDYWAAVYHRTALHTIAGLFGADGGATTNMDDNYLDSTAGGVVTGKLLKKGIYRLGDNYDKVALMLCHSNVFEHLDENEDIIMVPEGNGILYPTLRGTKIRVYVDDTMPYHTTSIPNDLAANNSAVYFFGEGALILSGAGDYLKPEETASTGQIALHSRKAYLLHPNGVSWQASAPTNETGQALTPTDAQLATVANWEVEWNVKNVPIIRQDVATA